MPTRVKKTCFIFRLKVMALAQMLFLYKFFLKIIFLSNFISFFYFNFEKSHKAILYRNTSVNSRFTEAEAGTSHNGVTTH